MKTVCFVFINGCPRAEFTASHLVEYFRRNGWKTISNIETADLIMASACGFDAPNEEDSIRYLSLIVGKVKQDASVIVVGCLAGINPELIHCKFDVTAIGSRNLDRLDTIIGAKIQLKDIPLPNIIEDRSRSKEEVFNWFDKVHFRLQLFDKKLGNPLPIVMNKALNNKFVNTLMGLNYQPLDKSYGKVFTIKVGSGCLGKCSYCAIKFDKGNIKSMPIDQIVKEFQSGLRLGYKIFYLLGDDVGAYGQDIETNIAELLRNLFSHQQEFKLFWDDFNPKSLIQYFPELLEIFSKNQNRIGHIGVPIQSGSERIIKLMNREHTVAEINHCLSSLKQSLPDIDICTHVLIGFPGETEKDFDDTMNLLNAHNFARIHIYRYTDRPKVKSTELPNKVPELIKLRREWRIRRQFKGI